jgi:hypothetical protein
MEMLREHKSEIGCDGWHSSFTLLKDAAERCQDPFAGMTLGVPRTKGS